MNYLLFVYYDNTVEDSELTTNEIALQLADQMTSKEAKFMFGDKHAIFHFSSDMKIDEMGGWIEIISEDLNCFQYILTPKPRNLDSNMSQDNLDHLLSLKKTNPKKYTLTPPNIRTVFRDFRSENDDSFRDIADIIMGLKREEVCNLTLDGLLDKMVDEGVNSLTELEKQKLEEYSKSL